MAVYEPGIVVRHGESKDGLAVGSFMIGNHLTHKLEIAIQAFIISIKQQHERQGKED